MQRLLMIASILSITGSARSQDIQAFNIIGFGIYNAEITGTRGEPAAIAGQTNKLRNVKLVKTTRLIPCKLGTQFGYEYKISGQNPGQRVYVTKVQRYPGRGILNPSIGHRNNSDTVWSTAYIGNITSNIFTLDHDYELVSGKWTFEIWVNSTYLGGESFTMGKCPPAQKS